MLEPTARTSHADEVIDAAQAHFARHDLDPAACVMVGDRRHDIAGAHANGVRALGVLWGYGAREEPFPATALKHPRCATGCSCCSREFPWE